MLITAMLPGAAALTLDGEDDLAVMEYGAVLFTFSHSTGLPCSKPTRKGVIPST
jgi:NAD/NADP transhydrogenase alpha subunit